MRRVQPGEVPVFGSIWRWGKNGDPILVLRVRQQAASWGERTNLIGIRLSDGKVDDRMTWAGAALVGMGPVLTEWYCVAEAPDTA